MTQAERRLYLIRSLLNEKTEYQSLNVPQQELADEGVTDLDDLRPVSGDLYLWQGDITCLKCGAIVNAANS